MHADCPVSVSLRRLLGGLSIPARCLVSMSSETRRAPPGGGRHRPASVGSVGVVRVVPPTPDTQDRGGRDSFHEQIMTAPSELRERREEMSLSGRRGVTHAPDSVARAEITAWHRPLAGPWTSLAPPPLPEARCSPPELPARPPVVSAHRSAGTGGM